LTDPYLTSKPNTALVLLKITANNSANSSSVSRACKISTISELLGSIFGLIPFLSSSNLLDIALVHTSARYSCLVTTLSDKSTTTLARPEKSRKASSAIPVVKEVSFFNSLANFTSRVGISRWLKVSFGLSCGLET
jgi:hypothetical protein